MFKFFIDVFCKDTIIGLNICDDIRKNRIYKNKYIRLFINDKNLISKEKNFIDPIACHL